MLGLQLRFASSSSLCHSQDVMRKAFKSYFWSFYSFLLFFAVQMVLLLCCRTRRGGLSEAVRVAMMFSYGFNCLPLHRVALLNWLKYYLNCLCPVVLCKQFCIFVLLYVRMWFSRSEISHNLLVIGQVAWPLIIVSFGAFSDGGHWKQSFLCSLCCALMETGWPALLAPWPVWHSLQLGKKKRGLSRKPSDE